MKHISEITRLSIASIMVCAIAVCITPPTYSYWHMDQQGNMVWSRNAQGQVLGETDGKDQPETPEKQAVEPTEQPEPAPRVTKIEQRDIEKVEIKKVEPEVGKEPTANDSKQVEVSVKKTNQEEVKSTQQSFEMQTASGDQVHVEMSPEKTQMEIKNNGVAAAVSMPLSVDPASKKLMVSTPVGDQTLESMPDEVVNNLRKDNQIGEQSKVQIKLQVDNGKITYNVQEVAQKKVAGIIPVTLVKNLNVADGTGQVLSVQESFLTKLLSLISF